MLILRDGVTGRDREGRSLSRRRGGLEESQSRREGGGARSGDGEHKGFAFGAGGGGGGGQPLGRRATGLLVPPLA